MTAAEVAISVAVIASVVAVLVAVTAAEVAAFAALTRRRRDAIKPLLVRLGWLYEAKWPHTAIQKTLCCSC